MTRQGPNYHDDPRFETDFGDSHIPITELQRRINKNGIDLARAAINLESHYQVEEKVPFISPEAKRLEGLIEKSDIKDPRIRERIRLMIDAAEQRGAITADEAAGLRHYLEHAEGFDDSLGRKRDFREAQAAS